VINLIVDLLYYAVDPRLRVGGGRGGTDMATAVARFLDSDIWYSFTRSPVTVVSAIVALVCIGGAVLAPWIAPHNPFDLASLQLMDAFKPPAWEAEGDPTYLLGTDDQGRDVLSAIMYGARVSLLVGFCAVLLSVSIGITAGLRAGYLGGTVDAVLMRIADIKLTFPTILIALLIDGVTRAALPRDVHDQVALYVVIFAIGISNWPSFARTVRGSTMVERNKEYVQAARVIGLTRARIMVTHVLPNVLGPVLVIATLQLGFAILAEATLSFLASAFRRPSLRSAPSSGSGMISSLRGVVDHHLPRHRADHPGAVRQPAGRLAARRPQPEASMMSNALPLLEVKNLRVEFPTRRGTLVALDDVSFDISPGEVLGVVGESGAGKSMTGAAIIGLLEPPGRIAGGVNQPGRAPHRQPALQGDAHRPRPRDRRDLPGPADDAEPALHGRPPAGGDDDHPPAAQPRAGAQKAIEWLELVGIPAAAQRIDSYPHEFSGGMRQRVVIALALCASRS
jgi:peptide/nickel transport system permease protein